MKAPTSLGRSNLHDAYARGLRPAELVAELSARIGAADDPGIFLHLEDEAALVAAADRLPPFDPEAYPLWGLPCAVKDNIDVRGMPTTCACPEFAHIAEADAAAVALLRAAGALILGKTNLDQFATGLVGVRTPYPVPRNALDPTLVPGGSSSGSAVAVARDLVSFALGTDTAGSGRVPAALNGIVGWKPSLGAISTRGVVPACRTLDCVSVFARGVDDAWSAFATMARYDAADPFARDRPGRPFESLPTGTRIGVPEAPQFFGDALQEAAFDAALAALAGTGAEIVPIDFAPLHEVAALLYEGAWVAERYAAIADFLDRSPTALHPVTATIIEPGRRLSAVDAFRGSYRLAELRRVVEARMAGLDLLAVPSIPRPVTLAEINADPIGPNSELGTYANFVNLLDLCGVALPFGRRADGRPGSLTLLARGGEDGRLLPFARALTGSARAAAALPRAAPDELELAVVGAHLSGMPLNGALTGLGARLLRTARTEPCYRLYALPGSPPRPGLLRHPTGGAAIEVEVWALPPDAFGRFVAEIPEPLGIGRLALSDGTDPSGFLVEAAMVDGAPDVTEWGGWRAYQAARQRPSLDG